MQTCVSSAGDVTVVGRRDRAAVPALGRAASGFHWRALWPAGVLFVAGLGGLVAATLAPTGTDGQFAVIAPPWASLGQTFDAIRAAHGDVAQMGRPARFIPITVVIAHSGRRDFVAAAYRAGAWLVIDPMRLRGCTGLASIAKRS